MGMPSSSDYWYSIQLDAVWSHAECVDAELAAGSAANGYEIETRSEVYGGGDV